MIFSRHISLFIILIFIFQHTSAQKHIKHTDPAQTFEKLLAFEHLRQLDSIKVYAANFLTITENSPTSLFRFWAYYYYSTSFYMVEQEACLDMCLKAHEGFVKQNNFMGIIKTANRLGNIYARTLNDISNSSKYYQYGLTHIQSKNEGKINDSMAYNYQVLFMNNLSINEMAFGNFEAAITLTTKALAYGKHYPNHKQQAMTLMNLANINSRLKNYDKSIAINRDLLALSKEMENTQYISLALHNIGSNFGEQNQLDSALIYLELAYEISKKRKDWASIAFKAINIGSLYAEKKQFENAQNHYNEALTIAQEHHLPDRENHVLNFMADNYLLQNQPEEALGLLKKNIKNIKVSKNRLRLIHCYRSTQEAYEMRGDYKSAYDYLKKWKNLEDSVKSKDIAKQVHELEIKYATEKKQHQIAQLKQEKLSQKLNSQEKLSFAGTAIFFLLTTGLFFFFKNKNQRLKGLQKASELEQRLLRSQMNPHFTFNALSSIQTYLLKSDQAQKGAYFLAKFAKLMRQILSQSRTSFITLEEEIETLENYLAIQKLRYDDRFEYEISIHKNIDIKYTQIPPMLIQPILENAIEHGKVYTLANGKINIDIQQIDDFLVVKIKDNGKGRAKTTSTRAKNYESISLGIIADRIAILQKKYTKKVNFTIKDPQEGGTIVLFTLPLRCK